MSVRERWYFWGRAPDGCLVFTRDALRRAGTGSHFAEHLFWGR